MRAFLGMTEDQLGEVLKKHRVERKYTQQKIAVYLDIDRTTYSKYENNSRKPELDVVMKLAALYNLSLDEFLGDFFVTKPDEVTPFKAAASAEAEEGLVTELNSDEKQLITFYRECIRKKEILDKAKEIWSTDSKIKNN